MGNQYSHLPGVTLIESGLFGIGTVADLIKYKGLHYVVSWTHVPGQGPETLVFPATPLGNLVSWLEVAGGQGLTPAEAVEDLIDAH
jgi:hypothetical protein